MPISGSMNTGPILAFVDCEIDASAFGPFCAVHSVRLAFHMSKRHPLGQSQILQASSIELSIWISPWLRSELWIGEV